MCQVYPAPRGRHQRSATDDAHIATNTTSLCIPARHSRHVTRHCCRGAPSLVRDPWFVPLSGSLSLLDEAPATVSIARAHDGPPNARPRYSRSNFRSAPARHELEPLRAQALEAATPDVVNAGGSGAGVLALISPTDAVETKAGSWDLRVALAALPSTCVRLSRRRQPRRTSPVRGGSTKLVRTITESAEVTSLLAASSLLLTTALSARWSSTEMDGEL